MKNGYLIFAIFISLAEMLSTVRWYSKNKKGL